MERIVRLKQIAVDILTNSTCHGIPMAISSNNVFSRIMWSLASLVCLVTCIITIVQTIAAYLSFNAVSKTSFNYEPVSEFPAVTICNANPMMSQKAISLIEATMGKINRSELEWSNRSNMITSLISQRLFFNLILLNSNLTETDLRELSTPLDKMIIGCTYEMESCGPDDFVWFYDEYFGNCYTFNSPRENGSTRYVYRPGRLMGLNLQLYIGDVKQLSEYDITLDTGFKVFINNRTDPIKKSESYSVPVGMYTDLSVGRLMLTQLSSPYSDCRTTTQKIQGLKYSQDICLDICEQKDLLKNCGCHTISMPSDKLNSNYCKSNADLICLLKNKLGSKTSNSNCSTQCPTECEKQIYKAAVTQSSFPSELYAAKLLSTFNIFENYSNITFDEAYPKLAEVVSGVSVYYESMYYTSVTEMPESSFMDMASKIGGVLGLFIGASFLSLLEFNEYLIQVCLYFATDLFNKAKRKSSSGKVTPLDQSSQD